MADPVRARKASTHAFDPRMTAICEEPPIVVVVGHGEVAVVLGCVMVTESEVAEALTELMVEFAPAEMGIEQEEDEEAGANVDKVDENDDS